MAGVGVGEEQQLAAWRPGIPARRPTACRTSPPAARRRARAGAGRRAASRSTIGRGVVAGAVVHHDELERLGRRSPAPSATTVSIVARLVPGRDDDADTQAVRTRAGCRQVGRAAGEAGNASEGRQPRAGPAAGRARTALGRAASALRVTTRGAPSSASSWRSTSPAVVFGVERRHAVLREQRGDQRVGVPHDRDGDTFVDHPVEPEHDGHALAGAHRGDDRREVPDQQLAEELQLLHHLAGREPARGRRCGRNARRRAEPDRADFPPERADHLGEDVDAGGGTPARPSGGVSWGRR